MPTIQQSSSSSSSYRQLHSTPNFLQSQLSSPSPHLLFDCDGLLLDTEPIYSHVALLSLRHFLNCTNTDEELFPVELKMKVMGGTKSLVSQQMANHLNSLLPSNLNKITAQEWADHTTPLESLHFSLGCPLMPGVTELITLVKSKGLPFAVATSSARETFTLKSSPHYDQVFKLFDTIVCGDDPDYSNPDHPDYTKQRPIVKGKPHPSIFLTARHHLNRHPSHHGIVLEDSPNGVVAALRSGHSCIWIPAVKDCSFAPIDEILNQQDIQGGLWVYRADSLYDVVEAIKQWSCHSKRE